MVIPRFIKICDQISEYSGKIISVFIWPVMILCVYEVITRRFFNSPHIWTYDVTNVFYGAHFMLLAAYTLLYKGHVAVDIVTIHFSSKTRLILNIINYFIFFFPFVLITLYVGLDSAFDSWKFHEKTTIGLPFIYPIMKTLTPITALLLLIQGLSELIKSLISKEKKYHV